MTITVLNNQYMPKNSKGFTLIELMIAISVVAVLATIGMVMYSSTQKTSRDAKRKADMRDIKEAMYTRKSNTGSFCIPAVACTISSNAYYPIDAFYSGYPTGGIPPILASYFKSSPADPLGATAGYYYGLRITGDSTFEVYGRLENTPTGTAECTPPTDAYNYNYCITQ